MEGRSSFPSGPEFIPLNERFQEKSYNNAKRKRVSISRSFGHEVESSTSKFGGIPWRILGKSYNPLEVIALHEEIEDFYQYICPTRQEHEMRLNVIKRIKSVVLALWPQAEVKVFGSFQTGLYLPTSDIDLVIIGKWKCLPLWTLRDALVSHEIADPSSVKVLDKATVPLVKLTDALTDVKVDISFNMKNGVESAMFINESKREFPPLAKLVMILKQFLFQRDLNEVFTGGISSYSLILLTLSFLQLHPRADAAAPNANLGVLLIEFFEFYGRHFNYIKTAISVKNGGSYFPKEQFQSLRSDYRTSILCIEDPLLQGNDIGKNSYGVLTVKKAFEHAFIVLSEIVRPKRDHSNDNQSILGKIISIKDEVIQYRKWIHQNFPLSNEIASCDGLQLLHWSPVRDTLEDNDEIYIMSPSSSNNNSYRPALSRDHKSPINRPFHIQNSWVISNDTEPNVTEGNQKRLKDDKNEYFRPKQFSGQNRQFWPSKNNEKSRLQSRNQYSKLFPS